jgi:hypothetical protein
MTGGAAFLCFLGGSMKSRLNLKLDEPEGVGSQLYTRLEL